MCLVGVADEDRRRRRTNGGRGGERKRGKGKDVKLADRPDAKVCEGQHAQGSGERTGSKCRAMKNLSKGDTSPSQGIKTGWKKHKILKKRVTWEKSENHANQRTEKVKRERTLKTQMTKAISPSSTTCTTSSDPQKVGPQPSPTRAAHWPAPRGRDTLRPVLTPPACARAHEALRNAAPLPAPDATTTATTRQRIRVLGSGSKRGHLNGRRFEERIHVARGSVFTAVH